MKKQTFLFRTTMKTSSRRLHKKMLDKSPQRKFLQDAAAITQGKTFLIKDPGDGEVDEGAEELSPPRPVFQPFNFSTRTPLKRNEQHQQASSLDSSMALTILVLLTALFFMGFFSLYLRRYAAEEDATSRRRRLTYLPAGVFSVSGNQKGKGLDISTVRSLPLVSYGEDVKQVMFSDCPICLCEFEQAEIVKIIPHCKHLFHPKCIDTWLASHVSCPFCRSKKFCKDEDVSDVNRVQDNNGVGVSAEISTVEEGYTWRERGIRRICSWTRSEDHVVLQRSLSF